MNRPAHDLLRAQSAGHERLRAENFEAAGESFSAAIAIVESFGPEPTQALAELLVARAEARIECERLDEAQDDLRQARRATDALVTLGIVMPAVIAASVLFNEARIMFLQRAYDAMAQRSRGALALLAADACAPAPGLALTARCHLFLATALSLLGQLDAAVPEYHKALALLDSPECRHLGKDRARALSNLANAEYTSGRWDDARAHYAEALALLEGQVDAGCSNRRIDIARTHMNLGGVLTSCNEFDAAIASYRSAIETYAAEIRRRRRRGANVARLCSSHADTWMNLAYTQFRAGQFEAASVAFKHALRGFKNATAVTRDLRDAEARAWVNHAHLLHAQQRLGAARKRYAEGAAVFTKLIQEGRGDLKADLANAELGLARVLAAQGRATSSLDHAELALRTLAALTRQGQLQHGRAWQQGLRGVADQLVAARGRVRQGAASTRSSGAFDRLAACLNDAPVWGHPIGAEPVDELLASCDQVANWCASAAADELTRLTQVFVRHLLGRTASLLGDADPAWLQQHTLSLSDAIDKLRLLASAHPDRAGLLADWFLCTRGLRAQRDALALSPDDRVRAYAGSLVQLRRIEEELLGQWQSGSGDSGVARAEQWMELHRRCEAESQLLTRDGLLPPRLRLQADEVAAGLRDGEALFLLARPVADRVLFIALRRTDADADALFAFAIEVPLSADLTPFRCNDLIGLVRRSMLAAGGRRGFRRAPGAARFDADAPLPSRSGEAEFGAAMLRALADAVAAPMLERVSAWSLRDVVLIASDDLHLLPWVHELARHWPAHVGLHSHPSVGTWLRHHRRTRPSAEALRWACAVCAPQGGRSALPWVQVEYALSLELWRESVPPPVLIAAAHRTAQGVSAFIGMGHGGAREGNLAAAGVELDAGEVLTAHDLPAIQTSRRVLLSCCVLGQTQEVLGEPLGFLSACFSYDTEFGSGWLTEVPDVMACLFSLAFQFALRERMANGTRDTPAWSDVFERTRRGIHAGVWPEHFGAWLNAQLPEVVRAVPGADGASDGSFTLPPPELQRLMPWVICVGR